MRRVFTFWWRRNDQPAQVWSLSEEQRVQLLAVLSDVGLRIVTEARGPVPLYTFARRVLERLDLCRPGRVPLYDFVDALKHVIRDMRHDQLRIMSPTDFLGVGYVFNAQDKETWPVRTSR